MTAHDVLSQSPDHERSLGVPYADIRAAREFAERFLEAELDSQERASLTVALTLLLDDPSRAIRRALAESLCHSAYVPGHLIRCLASDVDEVALPVLINSPVLSDLELVDYLAEGSEAAQCAIASREDLGASISAAICEVGSEAACRVLLKNKNASVLQSSLMRLAERFENCPDICDQLLKAHDFPLSNRFKLLMQLARNIDDNPDILERVPEHQRKSFFVDAEDKLVLRLALQADEGELIEFVEFLRSEGKLTTRLLLRAVCCGRLRFFAAALANLGQVPLPRLCKLLVTVRRSALQALLRKAGLPLRAHQAFLLAIDVVCQAETDFSYDLPLEEARALTEALLAEVQDGTLGVDDDIAAFLRRFAVDVARLEARSLAKNNGLSISSAA